MLSIMYKNKKCCEPIKGKLIEWFTVLTGLGEGAYYHLQYLIYSQTLSLNYVWWLFIDTWKHANEYEIYWWHYCNIVDIYDSQLMNYIKHVTNGVNIRVLAWMVNLLKMLVNLSFLLGISTCWN